MSAPDKCRYYRPALDLDAKHTEAFVLDIARDYARRRAASKREGAEAASLAAVPWSAVPSGDVRDVAALRRAFVAGAVWALSDDIEHQAEQRAAFLYPRPTE